MSTSRILVIRCSNLDGVNPVDEVDKVMAARGHCWFAKYGTPIKSLQPSSKRAIYVALTGLSGSHGAEALSVYELREMSREQPKVKADYPKYYVDRLHRVGTWLKLEPAPKPSLDIDEFVVRTSAQSLKKTLRNSMRGHFWCLWRGNDDDFI